MYTKGVLRDLLLSGIVESPLTPWYAAFLETLLEGGVLRVSQAMSELGCIQGGTLRDASAAYGQDRRFGSLGALCIGLHGGVFPTSVYFTTA